MRRRIDLDAPIALDLTDRASFCRIDTGPNHRGGSGGVGSIRWFVVCADTEDPIRDPDPAIGNNCKVKAVR